KTGQVQRCRSSRRGAHGLPGGYKDTFLPGRQRFCGMKWPLDQLCFCAVWFATVLRQHPELVIGSLTCMGALLAVAATTAYLRGNPPVSGILALSGAIAIGWAGAVALASFESPTALGWGLLGIGCGLASAWSFGVRRKFAGAFMRTGENGSCVQRLV